MFDKYTQDEFIYFQVKNDDRYANINIFFPVSFPLTKITYVCNFAAIRNSISDVTQKFCIIYLRHISLIFLIEILYHLSSGFGGWEE